MFNSFYVVWVNCVGEIEVYEVPLGSHCKFLAAQSSPNDIDLLLHYDSDVQCERIDIKNSVVLNGLVLFVRG